MATFALRRPSALGSLARRVAPRPRARPPLPLPTPHAAARRWLASEAIHDSSSCTFVNLSDGFSKFSDHWSPKVVGEVNGMHVKIVKLEGEFDWQCAPVPCCCCWPWLASMRS